MYITMLNITACFGVVMLHTNGIFWSHPKGVTWITSNFIETFMYWPVPIFFMISGATLFEYRKRYSTKVFMKKRLLKTLIPFIFWSIIAFYYHCSVNLYSGRFVESWIPNIGCLINYKYMYIYWFFVPLFAIYLSMPILNLLNGKWKLIRYLILYTFISYSIFPFLSETLHHAIDKQYYSPISSGYILYVLLGYYLNSVSLNKKTRYIIYALGVAGWALHFFGTLVLTPDFGGRETINMAFKGYMNFPCVFHSVAVFVLFKQCNFSILTRNKFVLQLINKMHASTLGIYLVHIYLLGIIVGLLHIDESSLTWRILGSLLIFVLAFVFVQCLKRIPIIRNVVP